MNIFVDRHRFNREYKTVLLSEPALSCKPLQLVHLKKKTHTFSVAHFSRIIQCLFKIGKKTNNRFVPYLDFDCIVNVSLYTGYINPSEMHFHSMTIQFHSDRINRLKAHPILHCARTSEQHKRINCGDTFSIQSGIFSMCPLFEAIFFCLFYLHLDAIFRLFKSRIY